MIDIPNFKKLNIQHIVCDYNGTIAKDGIVLAEIKALFEKLSKTYTLHVVTADTFGSVHQQLKHYGTRIKVLTSNDHTKEKADFISALDGECAAVGNGNNDSKMLQEAAVSIAVLGDEGCAKNALFQADIICKNITDALSLLIYEKRLVATLRK
jgi:soluble P-type ATPase